jgi:hypothetical protein
VTNFGGNRPCTDHWRSLDDWRSHTRPSVPANQRYCGLRGETVMHVPCTCSVMNRIVRFISTIVGATLVFGPAIAFAAPQAKAFTAATEGALAHPEALWSDRGDMASLNLLYGSGGREHAPGSTFTFVKEDKQGTNPKFEVIDDKGIHWKAKLGEEAQAETAATRLVWAAGYFTDEDYYVAELRVEGLTKLARGQKFVSPGGVVHGVRLERGVKGQKKNGNWTWSNSPFNGTKEQSGLRILMALTNNWDLKTINNDIYVEGDGTTRYLVSDLGATFGRTGNPLVRSKSNLKDYSSTKFTQYVRPEEVDFFLNSRPFFLAVFDVPNYITRTAMQGIVKQIPRAHAKWLGDRLGALSAEQIRDCFRAAGYSSEQVEGFSRTVQGRIAELRQL